MKQFAVTLVAAVCLAVSVASGADTNSRRDVEMTFDKYKGQLYARSARR